MQRRHFATRFALIASLLLAGGLVCAERAKASLCFAPQDTAIVAGSTARLAVMLDTVLDLRTIEIWVQYDPARVRSLAGGPGALFTDSGHFVWQEFSEPEPGIWHGYAVILGANDFVSGPGELYWWEFEGVGAGASAVAAIDVQLYAPDASLIDGVDLTSARVTVEAESTPVQEPTTAVPRLTLWPNPFNPRTTVSFDVPAAGPARVQVFDLQGRLVDTLFSGPTSARSMSLTWDGLDRTGRPQPGGVYLFQLDTRAGSARIKGSLLK